MGAKNLSVFSPNVGKRGPEKRQIRTLFTQYIVRLDFTFIISKLEFGFYKSHIYGLFTPVKNTFPNKY